MGTVKYLVFSFIIAIFAVSLYLSNPVSVSHTAGVFLLCKTRAIPFSSLISLPQCGQALFPVFDLRFQLLQLLHILPVGFDGVSAFSAGIELFIDPVGESVFLLLANGTGIG